MIIIYATVTHICLLFRNGDRKIQKIYKERLAKILYGLTEVCPRPHRRRKTKTVERNRFRGA